MTQGSWISVCIRRGFDTLVNQREGGCLQMSQARESKPHTWKCSLSKMETHKWQRPFCPREFQVTDLCSEMNRMLEASVVAGREIFLLLLYFYLITAKTIWLRCWEQD